MAEGGSQRRLAAIVAIDVAGYSRLMGADEQGTLDDLKAHRDAMGPLVAQHDGRLVGTAGDGLLLEFPSVVEAVSCAMEVQAAMAARNQDIPDDKKMLYRIGINLGDVLVEDDDIFGDGVNVAARIEALAEPGGICLSHTVHDQIRDRMDIALEDMGEVEVKNIARPVRVFRVLAEGVTAGKLTVTARPLWQSLGIVAVLAFAIIAGGGTWWWQQQPDFEPADPAKMAFKLPEKPSIAVLPFDNLSGDTKQDYFSDSISKSVISMLSKLTNMFVITAKSTFTYKGKSVRVQQVAEELGVRYVLEGSVQKSGQRVRVTAQLVDALNGHHLWSEKYDRDLDDIFALQDDIAEKILIAMDVTIGQGEQARLRRRYTENADAYLLSSQAVNEFRKFTKEGFAKAKQLNDQALELDPNFGVAITSLGWIYHLGARYGWSKDRAGDLAKAEILARKALSQDKPFVGAYLLLAYSVLLDGDYEQAIEICKKAIALEPNNAVSAALLAQTLMFAGRAEEALGHIQRAMRLSPYYPAYFPLTLGEVFRLLGRYDDAIAALETSRDMRQSQATYLRLAYTYLEAGRKEDARLAVVEVLKSKPGFSLELVPKMVPFKDPKEMARVIESLGKAGIPAHPPGAKPEKPSIAVLPFANMSGDKAQDYFADGISEDLTTQLSKISGLMVISRTSTFAYKGKSLDVRKIARDLGVRYILEGSVRRGGDQLRINAQLIDATTGGHLWAEVYDGPMGDVFALQDRINKNIVSAMKVRLSGDEPELVTDRGTKNIEAYEAFLRGERLRKYSGKNVFEEAAREYVKAIALDPNFADAHAGLGHALFSAAEGGEMAPIITLGKGEDAERLALTDLWARAEVEAEISLKIAERPLGLLLRAKILLKRKWKHEQALSAAKRAVELDPNSTDGHAFVAEVQLYTRGHDERGGRSSAPSS